MLGASLGFFFCYKLNHPFFEKYKAVDDPWPWETDRLEWNRLFWRSIKLTALNSIVINFVINYPSVAADSPMPFRDDTVYDSPFTLFMQVMFCNLVENLAFYFSHSLLHKPFFYKMVHKIHHEHRVTTSIAQIHAHPLEYVFGNVLPATIGCLVLGKRMHMTSYLGWIFWRNFEA